MVKCHECGIMNEDGMKFCEECGAVLEASGGKSDFERSRERYTEREDYGFAESVRERFTASQEDIAAYVSKVKTLVPNKISPCDGEIPIKQYFCATEKFLPLGLSLYHFIQVTNKRLIYCRMGRSILGPKVQQDEVPLSDVASVSLCRGYKLKIILFILAILTLLFGLFTVFSKPFWGFFWFFISFVCAFFMSNKYFKVKVGSKSGSNYPIEIGGIEKLSKNDDFLENFVSVVPVRNIDIVERELNTMILDIQQLGDYGIDKWREE